MLEAFAKIFGGTSSTQSSSVSKSSRTRTVVGDVTEDIMESWMCSQKFKAQYAPGAS